MRGYRPNKEMWSRINAVILGHNAAEVTVTLLGGLVALIRASGLAGDENTARVKLAAMVLSPDDGNPPGSLIPQLQAACAELDDGKWVQ